MNKRFTGILLFIIAFLPASEKIAAQNSASSAAAKPGAGRKIAAGERVTVRSDLGDIIITGGDFDKIEASASTVQNKKQIPVNISESFVSGEKVLLVSPSGDFTSEQVILEVKIPRAARLEPIQTENGSITVSNIEGPVAVKTGKGNVSLNELGAASVESAGGNVTARNIKGNFNARVDAGEQNNTASRINLTNIGGNVDITTGDGLVFAQNIGGDARLLSVNSGSIKISCVKGDMEISDVSSIINLASVAGGIDASNSTGEIYYIGEISAGKRYRLKTLTGVVSMAIPETSGFTAQIKSFSGEVRSDFALQNDASSLPDKNQRRLQGSYGDGKARINLDSFNGAARLRKAFPAAIGKCGQ